MYQRFSVHTILFVAFLPVFHNFYMWTEGQNGRKSLRFCLIPNLVWSFQEFYDSLDTTGTEEEQEDSRTGAEHNLPANLCIKSDLEPIEDILQLLRLLYSISAGSAERFGADGKLLTIYVYCNERPGSVSSFLFSGELVYTVLRGRGGGRSSERCIHWREAFGLLSCN